MARHELQPAINRARAEQLSHDNEKLSTQRWKSAEDVTAGLAGKSISEQLRLLRLQIEMRARWGAAGANSRRCDGV